MYMYIEFGGETLINISVSVSVSGCHNDSLNQGAPTSLCQCRADDGQKRGKMRLLARTWWILGWDSGVLEKKLAQSVCYWRDPKEYTCHLRVY